jgi:hypothetical protein
MRKSFRIRFVLLLLSVCAFGAVGLYHFLHQEPSFDGRYLSDWIWIMHGKESGPEKEQARAVVRQLGANSIPVLLDWLQQENHPSWTGRFDKVRHNIFFWLVGHKLITNRPITSLRDFNPSHSAMAMWALPELDPATRTNVIPTLIQMLGEKSQKPDEISRGAGGAFIVLSKMAPESIGPLIEALSSHDVQVSELAASALGRIGPDANAAIPMLKKGLQDSDLKIRLCFAAAIGEVGGDPNVFLPVVIQSLPKMQWTDLDYSLEILVRYKEHAKPAIPVLLSILNGIPGSGNPDNIAVRDEVINTIRQIDPNALAAARVE